MRKLSEITNEDALDVLADCLEPIIEISADKEFAKEFQKGKTMKAVQIAIKNHKKALLTILATLDGEPVETYSVNVIQIPTKVFELFNDKDMLSFFQSQGLEISDMSFGSATESTTATDEE